MRCQLVKRWAEAVGITVWLSPCIVTHPPPVSDVLQARKCSASQEKPIKRVLVNSANEALAGTALPYFPMLEAPPKGMSNTNWGGLSAGSGMFYRTQVIDGLVSELGGKTLRAACNAVSALSGDLRCPIGSAVATPATEQLRTHFDVIVHAVAPLFDLRQRDEGAELLQQAVASAIAVGFEGSSILNGDELWTGGTLVAVPLLGAGARGFPLGIAADQAAQAVVGYSRGEVEASEEQGEGGAREVAVVVREAEAADAVVESMEAALAQRRS